MQPRTPFGGRSAQPHQDATEAEHEADQVAQFLSSIGRQEISRQARQQRRAARQLRRLPMEVPRSTAVHDHPQQLQNKGSDGPRAPLKGQGVSVWSSSPFASD